MKKLTSTEVFRIPSNEFYVFINGQDFYSSGIFTAKKEVINVGKSFSTKGIFIEEDGCAVSKNKERAAVYNSKYCFDELLENSLQGREVLYRVQLSEFTRQGVIYGTYAKGFISLPAKIMGFILKHLSNADSLLTNGKSVYIQNGGEVIAIIESCEEPPLSDQEKEVIIQLSGMVFDE